MRKLGIGLIEASRSEEDDTAKRPPCISIPEFVLRAHRCQSWMGPVRAFLRHSRSHEENRRSRPLLDSVRAQRDEGLVPRCAVERSEPFGCFWRSNPHAGRRELCFGIERETSDTLIVCIPNVRAHPPAARAANGQARDWLPTPSREGLPGGCSALFDSGSNRAATTLSSSLLDRRRFCPRPARSVAEAPGLPQPWQLRSTPTASPRVASATTAGAIGDRA